ncbi:MAG: prephenate dehydrogenase/arogenate dehydrogenase family protein, partial [Endomicrobiaceae bacterium]
MKKVVIIGVGLMGGSLGMALRKVKKNSTRKYEIFGIGRNVRSLQLAKSKGAVDGFSSEIKDVSGADIAVICQPVDMIADTYKKISKYLSKETVVTDIGSIKLNIETEINGIIRKNK